MSTETMMDVLGEINRNLDRIATALEKAKDPEGHIPQECREHKCSYYGHYLVYGGPDLAHEGFHAAEIKCAEAQKRYLDWLKEHENDNVPEPELLRNQARFWEEKVRA